jgi:hypothetical protein
MAQNKQYNETLENICSFSHPANHLIVFQLIRAKPNEGVQERTSAKSEYFSFVTIAPGEGDQNSRTYNFQNSINIKFSLQEICALAYVLKTVSNGMARLCLPYTKFAKSANGTKQVSVWEPPQQPVQQGQFPKPRAINISIKENNNQAISIPLTPEQAFAISESLTILFQKGINLDFDRQVNSPKTQNTNKTNNSYANLNNANGFGPGTNQAQAPSNPFGQQSDILNAGGINEDFANILMSQ